MNKFTLRKASEEDLPQIRTLFMNTIYAIGRHEYTEQQCAAWADKANVVEYWHDAIRTQHFLVAEQNSEIVGFGSINKEGYIDVLYVHHAWQRKGVASVLYQAVEQKAKLQNNTVLYSHVSKSAVNFFKAKGFLAIAENTVVRQGIALSNTLMKKELNPLKS